MKDKQIFDLFAKNLNNTNQQKHPNEHLMPQPGIMTRPDFYFILKGIIAHFFHRQDGPCHEGHTAKLQQKRQQDGRKH